MTIAELIRLLESHPGSTRVILEGCADGSFHEIGTTALVQIDPFANGPSSFAGVHQEHDEGSELAQALVKD